MIEETAKKREIFRRQYPLLEASFVHLLEGVRPAFPKKEADNKRRQYKKTQKEDIQRGGAPPSSLGSLFILE
jgi:hypothetical protein